MSRCRSRLCHGPVDDRGGNVLVAEHAPPPSGLDLRGVDRALSFACVDGDLQRLSVFRSDFILAMSSRHTTQLARKREFSFLLVRLIVATVYYFGMAEGVPNPSATVKIIANEGCVQSSIGRRRYVHYRVRRAPQRSTSWLGWMNNKWLPPMRYHSCDSDCLSFSWNAVHSRSLFVSSTCSHILMQKAASSALILWVSCSSHCWPSICQISADWVGT